MDSISIVESELRANMFYYFREKQYNLMLVACKEGFTKFKGNVSFHLYKAMSLLLNNRVEECINELDIIRSENDVKLAVIIALMYAHKLLKVSSKELYAKLDSQMRESRKTANAVDFYHSAFVLLVVNKFDKAMDYLDKALSMQSGLIEALTLKGWILLQIKQHTTSKLNQKTSANAIDIFEGALIDNQKNLDATIGLAECYLIQNNFDHAFDVVNKAIVRFSSNKLPLIQKMRIQFATQQWEQTIETMNRITELTGIDLTALKTNILVLLCRDANYREAGACIRTYIDQLDAKEPKNGRLLLENAQLFSRVCARNKDVLKLTYLMAERAVQTDSENVDFIVELGYQAFLLGDIKEAHAFYKTATKFDSTAPRALLGLTLCEVTEHGRSNQTKNQIDFLWELNEKSPNTTFSSKLHLINAKIADSSDEALDLLNKACLIQLDVVKSVPYSDSYLRLLDPDHMIDLVKEYLKYSTKLTIKPVTNIKSHTLSTAQDVLAVITKTCPGLYEASYLHAKVLYFGGQTASATSQLDQILAKSDAPSDAYLLLAQIQASEGLYERAAQSLEIGLSHDFKVRENPIYHFINGLVEKNTNNLQDAIKSLTTALGLINVNPGGLTVTEKASIYVELIDIYNVIGQVDEASKLLEDVISEFQGTPEEARILILSADHAVNRGNVQTAIDLLSKVKSNESYYFQAKTKLADILLKYRMDKYAYLQCYQEMVDENPNSDSHILLGDAYMNILEPDEALNCYDLALQQNPTDPYLTSKMGKALVNTHYFAKAVAFYKEAIKSTENSDLKLQLADLYMQLKEYSKAEILLTMEIDNESSTSLEDLTYLQHKTKLLNLLAQIQEKSGNMKGALLTLRDARDNQNRVRKRFAVAQIDIPLEEVQLLVNIGVKLAEISSSLRDNEQAIQYYKDCLEYVPDDTIVLTALARLYMQLNYLENCQQVCSNILRIDAENEAVSVMMADIAFRKIDFDMALFHFTQLIIKQPTNWAALVRLVEIMRRTGHLENAPEYLSNAEQACGGSSLKEPGLLFCTALYQWYSGNLNSALRNFNGARQSQEWGLLAISNMIEICLNPDDEMLSDQFMDNSDSEYRDSRSMALKTADRLLKELKQRLDANGDDLLKYKLLQNFRLLATQEKGNIERALEEFVAIASQNAYKDSIGPILGMSTAYTLMKQGQRAKNQLKRIVKTTWTFEDAEYLERCWLLLADYYIQSAKFDVASDLLNKVVQHNKACSKAYEYLGFISEKEQHYRDASSHYECAWRFSGKSNTGIGFKLAFSLMKCKKYADAIDVGQQVLKLNPDYPRIKKDILDKSLNNLRT